MLSFLDDPSQNSNLANESVGKEELKEDTDRWGLGGGGEWEGDCGPPVRAVLWYRIIRR